MAVLQRIRVPDPVIVGQTSTPRWRSWLQSSRALDEVVSMKLNRLHIDRGVRREQSVTEPRSCRPLPSLLSTSLNSFWPSQCDIGHMQPRRSKVSSLFKVDHLERRSRDIGLAIYRRRSYSFSVWHSFRSFKTPELASFASCRDTSSACSNWVLVAEKSYWTCTR